MPFREPENAVNPVRSGGVLSLWSRSGELKSKPLSELSHVTGASRGAGCSAQFGWYRGYYSRPMERSVGRLFLSHFIIFYWEDPMKELAKQYDPSQVEDRIYQFWLDGGYFHTKADPDKKPCLLYTSPSPRD